jgi:hypothetical protein
MSNNSELKGGESFLVENDIRFWLRDNNPELNTLLDDYEFTPEEIRQALTYAQDYWNEQPPYIGSIDYDRTPFRFNLLQGTVANLLFIAANRYRRNHLQYQAGGVAIDDDNKATEYDQAGARLWEQYKQWVRMNKRTINASNGWATF